MLLAQHRIQPVEVGVEFPTLRSKAQPLYVLHPRPCGAATHSGWWPAAVCRTWAANSLVARPLPFWRHRRPLAGTQASHFLSQRPVPIQVRPPPYSLAIQAVCIPSERMREEAIDIPVQSQVKSSDAPGRAYLQPDFGPLFCAPCSCSQAGDRSAAPASGLKWKLSKPALRAAVRPTPARLSVKAATP